MIRVAINGYGRIGRSILRALYESGKRQQIQIVAINELAKPEAISKFSMNLIQPSYLGARWTSISSMKRQVPF